MDPLILKNSRRILIVMLILNLNLCVQSQPKDKFNKTPIDTRIYTSGYSMIITLSDTLYSLKTFREELIGVNETGIYLEINKDGLIIFKVGIVKGIFNGIYQKYSAGLLSETGYFINGRKYYFEYMIYNEKGELIEVKKYIRNFEIK